MQITRKIIPCLWFDDQAEEAANLYISIFPNSKIVGLTRYGAAGFEIHRRPAGSVMTIDFMLDGHPFTALNGGPVFKFNEAISFGVLCDTQDEIDYFWEKLSADPNAEQCGWLKDKFGVSWQVIPRGMDEMLRDAGSKGAERAMTAMMGMKKIDIDALKRAYAG